MASPEHIHIQNTSINGGRTHRVRRAAAEHSVVIRMLLRDFDAAGLFVPIPIFVKLSDEGLALVIKWLHHYEDAPKASDEIVGGDGVSASPVFTPWDQQFFRNLTPRMLEEVLVATNYLEIKPLYDLACQTVVNNIRGKNTEETRRILHIESDLTAEQERTIRTRPMWVFAMDDLLTGNY